MIIPTVDRPDMLARALRSIQAQRHATFEIIVADDGSGVGAQTARAAGGGAIQTFVTGRLGQVPARNMAIARARGRWIACLDDDDWWEDADHLHKMAIALTSGASFAYASGKMVREEAGSRSGETLDFAAHVDARSIRADNTLLISGIAYDRDLHVALGPLDQNLPHYWDWDWYLRVIAHDARVIHSGGDGVRISVRGDSVSSVANEALRRAELARLCQKHGLTGIVLKNHEIIALEQRRGAISASPII